MKKYLSLLGLLSLSLMLSCNQQASEKQEAKKEALKFAKTKGYLKNNCLSCHSETAGEGERLAPPFFAIRKHYLKRYPNEEAFTKAMKSFLLNPQKDHALMQGAVDKFGLMPPLNYPEGQLEDIVEYLYEVEQPKPQHKVASDKSLAKAKKMALATKKVLGKNLMTALQDSGKYHALSFCNVRAIPLTDSMSQNLAHSIKRVSDKARNPNNRASQFERDILAQFRTQLENGEEPEGQIAKLASGDYAYYPIITNAMCLQCHGEIGKDLDSDFYKELKKLYPQDEAIGYQTNQLRGMWVVELSESN